jgi:hypothetical protein
MRGAPEVTVVGQTISWTASEGVQAYVVKSHVRGRRDQRVIVVGTSLTPEPIEGETVEYVVRSAARDSEWSQPVTITFTATTSLSGEAGSGAGSGSVPGGGSGTGSGTGSGSEPVAGSGSESEKGAGAEPGTGSSGTFETGVVPTTLSAAEPSTIRALGAGSVRMEFPIGSAPSALASAVEAYAKVGVRVLPLAGFPGSMPTPAEAQNLATWAAAYGPGGTFWAGKGYPASVAVTDIEFGNETSYTYQYADNSSGAYAARAQAYALRLKEAEIAVKEVNPAVGLLAQADDGGTGSPAWVQNMFAAVPDLASRVAGWTVHPYGPTWQRKLDDLVNFTAAEGAPSSIPIYVTELGISVDNGHCVTENYGWNPCMSDSEAASTLAGVVDGMRSRYGKRLRGLYLYQAQDEQAEGASNNRESYFGLLQANGAAKGAYTTEVESLLGSGDSAQASGRRGARLASVEHGGRHHRLLARIARRRHHVHS